MAFATKETPQREMLRDLLRSMCHRPELLTVTFNEGPDVVRVQIKCHPTDSRIIVGRGRSHLNAVETLARLLWYGSHKLIQFMPVASTDHKETAYRHEFPKTEWQENETRLLLERLTALIFPASAVTVESREENSKANRFDVTMDPMPENSAVVKRFAAAIAVLFLPIGCAAGRQIFTNVKR